MNPLPWYSICLYVFQNAVKDSKKGLSRTALIAAATGKSGHNATVDGKEKGDAGEVIVYLKSQCQLELTLLDTDTNRTKHLCEINAAPPETFSEIDAHRNRLIHLLPSLPAMADK